MTTLKNKRLSDGNRSSLYRLAARKIEETTDTTELDETYAAAKAIAHKAAATTYPPKDMQVLKRYGATLEDECIYLAGPSAQYLELYLRCGDGIIRPYSRGCNRQAPFAVSDEDAAAITLYNDTKKLFDAALKTRRDDFYALINTAKSFNELSAIWPAAEELRQQIVGGNSLVAMNDEVMERIKSDPALAA